MKNKIIALTLTAALALSSTSAFAATTTDCEKTFNYDLSSMLKGITSNSNVKQYKLTVNGQEMDLNSIDWNTVLNKTTTAVQKPASTQQTTTAPAAAKPTATQPVAAKPAATTPAVTKPATPVATKPATTAPAAKPATTPAVTQPATPVATKPAATTPVATKPTTQTTAPSTAATTPSNTVSSSNLSYEQKVAELVNIERQKAGLSALTFDQSVSNVARTKSKDMAANNYFAHQSPTYGSAGDMLTRFGIKWSAWGENIASGQKTPEAVVTAWMNSPGHRANILSTNFSKIGVGYAVNSNGTPYWTQIFTN
ncbi:CAP domain-containing protein [Sedimentibacter sp. B4]|uniref:CAP domain-containing protein n=1 Tax=Sedimentibacter sp. B4 TaxID=304766 RepID=UPI0002D53D2E|nr:CAP domain-containing protein [Sedimentibacter sp. B4]